MSAVHIFLNKYVGTYKPTFFYRKINIPGGLLQVGVPNIKGKRLKLLILNSGKSTFYASKMRN